MTLREIDALIEEGQSLKQISQAYSEIANLKMKRIRTAAERNRIFLQEISQVYGFIRQLALKKKMTVAKPKKSIALILTSNYRFYGNINSDLINFFIATTFKLETDRIIIGKAAIDYFKTSKIFANLHPFVLKDDQPNAEELRSLVEIIKDYNQVLVFHSRLKSVLVQQPTFTQISTASQSADGEGKLAFRFIFEPELLKILQFFDSQILTLLLEGTFLESEVSRTASRFISMDQAETQANKFIREYEKLKAYTKRNLDNNTILENFASMMVVRKESL